MNPRDGFSLRRGFVLLVVMILAGGCRDSGPSASHPSPALDVRTFGATGDGSTLDTDAINRAIAAAHAAGGGTVYFPAGTYASHSIHLQSNVALYLGPGSTILAADPMPEGQPGGYDPPESNAWDKYQDFGHTHWHNSLIWGEDLENISILGPGRIFGRGLSRGQGAKDPFPSAAQARQPERPTPAPGDRSTSGPNATYPNPRDTLAAGIGNKAIALKNCRNVLLRDFTILHGGHFGILATGVDNFTLDNLTIDTNRDGMDIDCCYQVRVSNCSVNSPLDDGICLKSSHGLGKARPTENVTITGCIVSGYDEGTLLDGTRRREWQLRNGPIGRIKFGTESNGGFKNIAISNCVFDYCRGLAIETVDGGWIEDVSVSNLTMRDIVNAPIFIRLGARLRGPDNPPAGVARRINISNIVAHNVSPDHGILIAGLPGHTIDDVQLNDLFIGYRGGGTREQAAVEVMEHEQDYPEPSRFGILPAYGLFARHVQGLAVRNVELRYEQPDLRPPLFLQDVTTAAFDHLTAPHADGIPAFVLRQVRGLAISHSAGLPETHREDLIQNDRL